MVVPESIEQCSDAGAALRFLGDSFSGRVTSVDGWAVAEEETLPPLVRHLLVHQQHMTSTLRDHFGGVIALHVLQVYLVEDLYCREIILTHEESGRIVEYGLVRIDLGVTTDAVRRAIEEQLVPLGDILVTHDVLRRIEPRWYLRFSDKSSILSHFDADGVSEAYGRLGVIHCHGRPAIELLEVVPAFPAD